MCNMHLLFSSLYKVLQLFGVIFLCLGLYIWTDFPVFLFHARKIGLLFLTFCLEKHITEMCIIPQEYEKYWLEKKLHYWYHSVLCHLRIHDFCLFVFTFLVCFCYHFPECLCRIVHLLWNWPCKTCFPCKSPLKTLSLPSGFVMGSVMSRWQC